MASSQRQRPRPLTTSRRRSSLVGPHAILMEENLFGPTPWLPMEAAFEALSMTPSLASNTSDGSVGIPRRASNAETILTWNTILEIGPFLGRFQWTSQPWL